MSVGRDGNRSKAAANHTSTRLRMVGSRHLVSPQDPNATQNEAVQKLILNHPQIRQIVSYIENGQYSIYWMIVIAPTDIWVGTWALICRLLYDWI